MTQEQLKQALKKYKEALPPKNTQQFIHEKLDEEFLDLINQHVREVIGNPLLIRCNSRCCCDEWILREQRKRAGLESV